MVTKETSAAIRVVTKIHDDRQMRIAARTWCFLSPLRIETALDWTEAVTIALLGRRSRGDMKKRVFVSVAVDPFEKSSNSGFVRNVALRIF